MKQNLCFINLDVDGKAKCWSEMNGWLNLWVVVGVEKNKKG